MTINPAQIELTLEQKRLLALKAERAGVDYATMLDEWLSKPASAPESTNSEGRPSVLERMRAHGAVGCVVGPGDLTT